VFPKIRFWIIVKKQTGTCGHGDAWKEYFDRTDRQCNRRSYGIDYFASVCRSGTGFIKVARSNKKVAYLTNFDQKDLIAIDKTIELMKSNELEIYFIHASEKMKPGVK